MSRPAQYLTAPATILPTKWASVSMTPLPHFQVSDGAGRGLEFEPTGHVFRYNGTVLPSITQVLSSTGLIHSEWFTEEAAWRGSVVHRCCELLDEGTLDEDTIDPVAAPYLAAWKRFREAKYFGIHCRELPLYSVEGYAGIPDRVITVDGSLAVIELKTGPVYPWVALQLAAQANFFERPTTFRRIAVRLQPNGKPSIKEFPQSQFHRDIDIFRAALKVKQFMEAR